MDLGLSFTKYAVFFFNFLFLVLGIVMVVIGAGVRTKFTDFQNLIDHDLTGYPILFICVGCVLVLIAFLGCCGAIKENTCMLLLYSLIVLAVIIIEVVIIFAVHSKKEEMGTFVDKRLKDTLHKSGENQIFMDTWNLLQKELHCCGIDGPQDWSDVSTLNRIPGSCCRKPVTDSCNLEEAEKTGCKKAFIEYLKDNIFKVAGWATGVGVVQILALIFSCCLYSVFRRNDYNHY